VSAFCVIDVGQLTLADVVSIVGAAEFARFQQLKVFMPAHEKA
jgi:hypothetical protein